MQTYSFKNGRKLAFQIFGDPNGVPIFYAHGGPGSRLEAVIFDGIAKSRGYKIIATDRPGMGKSDHVPDRILSDYANDIAELADHLGIDRFGVIGWSGGGAHSLICAYKIPHRLFFCISIAGYTNFGELDNAKQYLHTKIDRVAVGLFSSSPWLFKLFFKLTRMSVLYFPELTYKGFLSIVCDEDKKIAGNKEFKAIFLATQAEAFVQGSLGVYRDSGIHYLDWGFKLSQIEMPVHILHGSEDNLVPIEFSRHISAQVKNCKLHIYENEGHLIPYTHLADIFDIADAETTLN